RADLRSGYSCKRVDCDVLADDSLTINLNRRMNDGIGTNLNVRIDKRRVRIDNRDTLSHQHLALSAAHHAIDLRQFLARVDAKDFFYRLDLKRADSFPLGAQLGDHVAELVL